MPLAEPASLNHVGGDPFSTMGYQHGRTPRERGSPTLTGTEVATAATTRHVPRAGVFLPPSGVTGRRDPIGPTRGGVAEGVRLGTPPPFPRMWPDSAKHDRVYLPGVTDASARTRAAAHRPRPPARDYRVVIAVGTWRPLPDKCRAVREMRRINPRRGRGRRERSGLWGSAPPSPHCPPHPACHGNWRQLPYRASDAANNAD